MPAHIGFLDLMKLPLDCIRQLSPTHRREGMSSMGLMSPGEIYEGRKKIAEDRNYEVNRYKDYRDRVDQYDPYHPSTRKPVDKTEWDHYLRAYPKMAFLKTRKTG